MFLSKEVATVAGALGMVLLAISWHKRRNEGVSRLAQFGWILVGFWLDRILVVFWRLDVSGFW